MKSLLVFLTVFCSSVVGFAQCTVDLGEDIHVCTQLQSGFPDTPLATDLTVTNAMQPLTYEWSMEPIEWLPGYTVWASDYLDDTTAANPTMFGIFEDSLTLFLSVTDADQQTCRDTINVTASLFGTHLGSASFTIAAGDSVQLFESNVVSNYPTDSILWQPTTGLNNPNAPEPWASPETNQQYHAIIWDSQGCMQEGSPFLFVSVDPVGILESETPAVSVSVNKSHLSISTDEAAVVQVWDMQGRGILQETITKGKNRIAIPELSSGLLVYSIVTQSGVRRNGKLLMR